uniref:Nuclear receptor domain-containing protein n=1 Tax=Panagrolaimus sp. ES5 TaxID=591445 RepID=A0AC34G1T2_9BILA
MCVLEKTCKVCDRTVDDTDVFCDDCYDFFINYFDSTEFVKCKNSKQCINGRSFEVLGCEQCRTAKCIKSGMKLPDFMLPDIPATTVYVDPSFKEFVVESLKELNNY